ncbi:MAG: hypothetical protein SFV15_08850 [Polyangiaceae bacterium]|nr:hypothetical protein [Polyangiaceae bacterium]
MVVVGTRLAHHDPALVMNFFGHACIAARRERSAEFILGAMLPDFASMLGARGTHSTCDETAAGIRFHHATDRVFHETRNFKDLSLASSNWLSARALDRGPARAVAHIGTEILLDTFLAQEDGALLAYTGALCVGTKAGQLPNVTISPPHLETALPKLCGTLLEATPRLADPRPEAIALRVFRTLSHRPKLALKDTEVSLVTDWARHFAPEVCSVAASWMQELENELKGAHSDAQIES